ncbi:MAG TPA: tRNA (N6-isopentenyl adenosine(37)-C2)-methylthiotransferase MiaB [Armatimonadota bacterium]|nr:tRNA (N6-isopentenyl adenosine(37)-C2)-methylthiotransferase MiaB [Armatimonadota bacterium]
MILKTRPASARADSKPLTFHLTTFGCQMSEHDSEQVSSLLISEGYHEADSAAAADVALINTCSVRERPENKVWSLLGHLKEIKAERPGLLIGVMGCMAQKEQDELIRRAPHIDFLAGTANVARVPALIRQASETGERAVALDLPRTIEDLKLMEVQPEAPLLRPGGKAPLRAYVNIMYGCDKFCTFCIVPYVRGRERSRTPEAILEEARSLARDGTKEIILLGQTVNSYGKRGDVGIDFAELLRRLHDIEGIERIRFTSPYPKDFSDHLIDTLPTLPKVCEHIHLPLQAGDDELLRRMMRRYTLAHYRDRLERLRSAIPNLSVTTDLMVGFPGETEKQFRHTLDAVREFQFDAAYTFIFSPRQGTVAATMDDQIPREVKSRRLTELANLQNSITLAKNERAVGETVEVLVEGPSKNDPFYLTGHTRTNRTAHFPGGPRLLGKLALVRVESAHPWGYAGEVV